MVVVINKTKLIFLSLSGTKEGYLLKISNDFDVSIIRINGNMIVEGLPDQLYALLHAVSEEYELIVY